MLFLLNVKFYLTIASSLRWFSREFKNFKFTRSEFSKIQKLQPDMHFTSSRGEKSGGVQLRLHDSQYTSQMLHPFTRRLICSVAKNRDKLFIQCLSFQTKRHCTRSPRARHNIFVSSPECSYKMNIHEHMNKLMTNSF